MSSPRFVLVVSAESNLLRASLVTRDLKSVAFARQTFQLIESQDGTQEFDPAQVWYLMKKVIAACLDIGRTLSREIGGVAIVGEAHTRVVWSRQGDEVISRGCIGGAHMGPDDAATPEFTGTLADWLWWNLTGGVTAVQGNELGKTRARAPFDAELPIVALWSAGEIEAARAGGGVGAGTELAVSAADLAWKRLDRSEG